MGRWFLAVCISIGAATMVWSLMSTIGLLDVPWPLGGNSWGQSGWHAVPGGFGLFVLFVGVAIFSIFHLAIPLILAIGTEGKDKIKSVMLIAASITLIICAILFGNKVMEYPSYVLLRCLATIIINTGQAAFCVKLAQSSQWLKETT